MLAQRSESSLKLAIDLSQAGVPLAPPTPEPAAPPLPALLPTDPAAAPATLLPLAPLEALAPLEPVPPTADAVPPAPDATTGSFELPPRAVSWDCGVDPEQPSKVAVRPMKKTLVVGTARVRTVSSNG